ncbi:hypothetical protein Val02_28560 [Virgisporangium aliadipatigenens]|uniref:G domain-containing protein n=1 Tax=Virgisporangium aliadipatigenens TaxID=741659 RepID=A0A8J4DPI5_9ACTN|nr:GTPase [Virgisporangium aliadipatigenens]GIJ45970.1 hypothetical protein Val02_28560 [Virgisporangium aliadipatigenens]
MAGLSDSDKERLRQEWERELTRKPPTIGVVGVSGVGKSSTINTMFRTDLPISHTVACTKAVTDVPLRVRVTGGPGAGRDARLVVRDAPGLGEDVRRDPAYLRMYEETLPECDVILWVMTARQRAVALDQQYLRHFTHLHDRIVFGLSQVDLVEPRDWKAGSLVPSKAQERHIEQIRADRAERLGDVLGRPAKVIPYSNHQGFNLEWLFAGVLEACTPGRKWIFEGLRNFRLEDWIPATPAAQPTPTPAPARERAAPGVMRLGADIWRVLFGTQVPTTEELDRMDRIARNLRAERGHAAMKEVRDDHV